MDSRFRGNDDWGGSEPPQVEDAPGFVVILILNKALGLKPGGAVALAALLAGRLPAAGRTVAIVLSGGNVDPDLYAEILSRAC